MGIKGMHQLNPSTEPEFFADFWIVAGLLDDGCHPKIAYCSPH
uniref:Uncharacterized protein n=1 Tax=Setaria italica TaxID=4555 RepID=K3ZPQ1_SETIT